MIEAKKEYALMEKSSHNSAVCCNYEMHDVISTKVSTPIVMLFSLTHTADMKGAWFLPVVIPMQPVG